ARRGALGLEPAGHHDRFALGAATLGLLAAAGGRKPLRSVCGALRWRRAARAVARRTACRRAGEGERKPLLAVVVDLHWLDRPSADALRFAARRLLAGKVAGIGAGPFQAERRTTRTR